MDEDEGEDEEEEEEEAEENQEVEEEMVGGFGSRLQLQKGLPVQMDLLGEEKRMTSSRLRL